MGNANQKQEKKQGSNPYTRSGLPPPKLYPKSGSDAPVHRINDPMSLELHMADDRMRMAGLSDAERQWRHQYLKDQHLHPDEPIHVDAVHRQLNPIRLLYRYPLDWFYLRYLQPTFGWQRKSGVGTYEIPRTLRRYDELVEKHPDLLEIGVNDPSKYRYFHPGYEKRVALLDVGETQRPW